MGTVTTSLIAPKNSGSFARVDCLVAFGSSYNNTGSDTTTGETINASAVGLSQIFSIATPSDVGGYTFGVLGLNSGPATSARLKVFQSSAATTGATSGGTPAAQTFTGTTPLASVNLATPAFSGTGLTAAAQVITTTSTHTMTLNQCAGMWLVSATGATPPNLILSNTAVSGAAAVLTVQGSANTDAGAYKIVTALAPVGTNGASAALATHTHSLAAGAETEVPNATNLATTLATVPVIIYGY